MKLKIRRRKQFGGTHKLLAREKPVGHELPGTDGDCLVVRHGWFR